jgi:DNA-binding transcriptional MocR family regulator
MVQKYKLIVIEDDAYRFLHNDPPPTFLSLIPKNTIHIFSLSKPYNSFIKCCFIIQPEDALPQLAGIISDTGSFATSLSLMFSRFLLKNNMLFRLAHEKQRHARNVQAMVRPLLDGLAHKSFPTGFHYWIKLPQNINSKECTNQLMARKIMVTGAHEYSVNGNNGYIRIALSAEKDLDQLKKALTTIRELLLGGIR